MEEKRPCGYLVTMSKNSACGTNGYLCDDCSNYFEGYNKALEDELKFLEYLRSQIISAKEMIYKSWLETEVNFRIDQLKKGEGKE